MPNGCQNVRNKKRKYRDILLVKFCNTKCNSVQRGPDSSVGIATDYGMDGPR